MAKIIAEGEQNLFEADTLAAKFYRIFSANIVVFAKKTPFLLICLIFSSQQALCLLPLTSLDINPYCAYLQVPLSQQRSICLYKWSAAAIPYGIPLILTALTGLKAAYAVHEQLRMTALSISIVSLIIGGAGASFLVIWLFAGIPIGIWFRFAGLVNSYLHRGHLMIDCIGVLGPYISFFLFDVIESIMYPMAALEFEMPQ